MKSNTRTKAAFTLTELLVLVAIGAVLTGVALPELSQTRSKLLDQACVANLHQWGMAVHAYTEDNRGWMYNNANAFAAGNPLNRYALGNDIGAGSRFRRMRNCPAYVATVTPSFIDNNGPVTYAFCRPNRNTSTGWGLITINAGNSYNFKKIPRTDQFLLIVDVPSLKCAGGNIFLVHSSNASCITAPCNDFFATITEDCTGNAAPLKRHAGGVNVLFADQHVAFKTLADLQRHSNYGTLDGWFASEKPADTSIVIRYGD